MLFKEIRKLEKGMVCGMRYEEFYFLFVRFRNGYI